MTVRICCDTDKKVLQQNAFAYDDWSVSHFLPSEHFGEVTACNFAKCSHMLKIVSPANSTINS